MTKASLRKIYREKRSLLTDTERMKADDLLLIRFQQIALPPVTVLMSYCPSEKHTEPNTWLFSGFLEHMMPGLQVAYPVTNVDDVSITPALADAHTSFEITPLGIEEPVNGTVIDPLTIDLVFVPMLICDEHGFRVGFGKGFYDRFLPRCHPDVLKIGFSYFEPVDHISDTDQFDIPLNICITPQQVYTFD